jgi:hypothetical protein
MDSLSINAAIETAFMLCGRVARAPRGGTIAARPRNPFVPLPEGEKKGVRLFPRAVFLYDIRMPPIRE